MSTSKPNYDPRDFGVLLYACTDPNSPPVTVYDKAGNSITPQALSNTVFKVGLDCSQAGTSKFLSLRAAGVIAALGTAVLQFEALHTDDANSSLFARATIQTIRGDNGAALAQHSIAAADLLSPVSGRQDILFQTTDAQNGAAAIRPILKWGQAPAAGDWLVITARGVYA